MKLNITVLVILTVISISFGCKKETTPTTPNSSSKNYCRVATVHEQNHLTNNSYQKTYHYDNQGRVIKELYASGYTLFSYDGNKLIIREYNLADQEIIQDPRNECYINSDGYIVKRIRYQKGTNYFNTSEYTYSPEGYMVQSKYTDEDKRVSVNSFTVENGNTIKIEDKSPGGLTVNYTYLTDENKAGMHQGFVTNDVDGLAKFYGKPNRNLVNTYTINNDAAKYFYDMENGLPKYSKLVTGAGKTMYEVSYTFDCK